MCISCRGEKLGVEDMVHIEVHTDPSNHPEEGLCFVLAFPYKLLSFVPALEDNPTQFNMNIRLGCSFDNTLLTQLLTILSHLFLSCCCLGEIHVSILTNLRDNYFIDQSHSSFPFLLLSLCRGGAVCLGTSNILGTLQNKFFQK